jgi:hypothetical protein
MRISQRAAKNLDLPVISYAGGGAHMRHEVYELDMGGIKKEDSWLWYGS